MALVGVAHAQTPADRAAIEKTNGELRAAWDARDASRVFPTNETARADLQMRMNQTTAILEMKETACDVTVTGGEATVVSDQLFRRMVKQPGGVVRERI